MGRTIFIGDIHGCALEFKKLLEEFETRPGVDRVYLTGDAFTKGPDPIGVWDLIHAYDAKMVMGNHEDALLKRLLKRQAGKEKKIKPEYKRTLDTLGPISNDLVSWIQDLPLYIEEANFVLVHAGIHPQEKIEGTTRDEFLAIRRWPPEKGIGGPRWHDVYEPVYPLLVFGHDAPGGLVIKKKAGRPYLIGLDSGCVYGRKLSGYCLEADRVLQVNSEQPFVSFG